ncbi:MAG: hypothetical protein JRI71_15440 [Deltaproteobacteria bacterium]|nr:hypothetical protein [Deltaproteobacteria bacterium]MBW2078909.1 hypothetical protein [Deltaproteobacteria bacterium]
MANSGLERAIVTDVTLREYGQNVPERFLPVFTPEIRAEIALRLIGAGFRNIEVLSCVHPAIAPAMKRDAVKKTSEKLGRIDGVNLIALVPNRAGYEAFLDLDLGPDGYDYTMGIFFSAVEAHNLANVGRPIKDTLEEYRMILNDAASLGIQGYRLHLGRVRIPGSGKGSLNNALYRHPQRIH